MGYHEAPWVFKGRALYQIQLVKVDEARKYVPDGFNLVSLFGYTLGGFYLARYTDSPVGPFDELVAMAGLIWNFPTSCAWAARVYVNNWDARTHGRRSVGLPSRHASFTQIPAENLSSSAARSRPTWWDPGASCDAGSGPGPRLVLRNVERGRWQPWARSSNSGGLRDPVCTLCLPAPQQGWPGPRIQLALPSFSGATSEHPSLLSYACALHTNVRLFPGVRVHCPEPPDDREGAAESLAGLFKGRPLLTLQFDDMAMLVEQPQRITLQHRDGLHSKRLAAQPA